MDAVVQSLEHSKGAAREFLAKYVREHVTADIPAETLLLEELPVTGIVKAAQDQKADLIVMGTHGRSGFSRAMLGSVSERVLRETRVPVLTVRHKKGETTPSGPVQIKNVLCPVNYTEVSQYALAHAVAVAGCFEAELTVLHVSEAHMKNAAVEAEMARLCSWVPAEYSSQCKIQHLVREGAAANEIIAQARSLGCDMIVLGAQHQGFFDSTVIGTTSVRVVRHSPCPVLTVIRQ
jgi:nucleotide-binding universal stress UspA family protein